jgi:hypothetical protein
VACRILLNRVMIGNFSDGFGHAEHVLLRHVLVDGQANAGLENGLGSLAYSRSSEYRAGRKNKGRTWQSHAAEALFRMGPFSMFQSAPMALGPIVHRHQDRS